MKKMNIKTIITDAGIVTANVVTWTWKVIYKINDIPVDLAKVHEFLGCILTLASTVFVIIRIVNALKSKNGTNRQDNY